MIACNTTTHDRLRVEGLLFLFAQGERVAPPDRLFLTFDYRGSGGGVEWISQGWQTSEFEEQWEPYTHHAFFG